MDNKTNKHEFACNAGKVTEYEVKEHYHGGLSWILKGSVDCKVERQEACVWY